MQRNADFSSVRNLLILERETGFEPATSSLGIQTYVGSKSLARFCCEFLNLQSCNASPNQHFPDSIG
jgi:hypothetical protein